MGRALIPRLGLPPPSKTWTRGKEACHPYLQEVSMCVKQKFSSTCTLEPQTPSHIITNMYYETMGNPSWNTLELLWEAIALQIVGESSLSAFFLEMTHELPQRIYDNVCNLLIRMHCWPVLPCSFTSSIWRMYGGLGYKDQNLYFHWYYEWKLYTFWWDSIAMHTFMNFS